MLEKSEISNDTANDVIDMRVNLFAEWEKAKNEFHAKIRKMVIQESTISKLSQAVEVLDINLRAPMIKDKMAMIEVFKETCKDNLKNCTTREYRDAILSQIALLTISAISVTLLCGAVSLSVIIGAVAFASSILALLIPIAEAWAAELAVEKAAKSLVLKSLGFFSDTSSDSSSKAECLNEQLDLDPSDIYTPSVIY